MSSNEKGLVVMVVDDDFFRQSLGSIIKAMGIDFKDFSNPAEALENIGDLNPQVILLDYEMPELTGYQFMVKYSEKMLFHDRSVFLITGADLAPEMKAALPSLGIEKYFPKPVNPEELIENIKRALKENSKD